MTEIVLFEFIDRRNRLAYLAGGRPIPITNLFDEFGDAVDDIADAHSIVAGPLPNGQWAAVDLSQFDNVTIQ